MPHFRLEFRPPAGKRAPWMTYEIAAVTPELAKREALRFQQIDAPGFVFARITELVDEDVPQ